MKKQILISVVFAALLSTFQLPAAPSSKDYRNAVKLYENGMYEQSRALLDAMPSSEKDALSEGYKLLCSIQLKSPGYEKMIVDYQERYGRSNLTEEIALLYGMDLFDAGRYAEAQENLTKVSVKSLARRQATELIFKKAYCAFALEKYPEAAEGFEAVLKRPVSEYVAPSQYSLGYIAYTNNDFGEAFTRFEQAASDPRFDLQARYYMLECAFMQGNYKYVLKNGDALYDEVPAERKQHLARILSETYLVKGEKEKAKKYYDEGAFDKGQMSRADRFYAGSLQYSLGNYPDAIANFKEMRFRNDSIGQIASYQMGYSYIQTKNKVAAMDAFREACLLEYDKAIREDALFNYAKLAFDLNHDSSAFKTYLQEYKGSGRHDLIYDYIAVASLYNRDYQGAIDAYDDIDELSPHMKSNYMKANYLRATQLMGSGAWADAVPCLKAVTFYTSKQDNFNKLARYWLGETYYRSEKYGDALGVFTDLYNNSALDRETEGKILPYNIAYCYFKDEDYASAATWFDRYIESRDKTVREDAFVRRADCDFIRRDYAAAADSYGRAVAEFNDPDKVYPYYRRGISLGLSGRLKEEAEALEPVKNASRGSAFRDDALYELGRTYVSLKDEAAARSCFRDLASSAKDSTFIAKSLIELGMMERNSSNYDKALEYYAAVARDFKGSESAEDALLAIESIYQSKGEPEKYLAFVEGIGNPAKTEMEKDAIFFNSAEQIYLAGNYEKAVASIEKYLVNYPDGEGAARARFYLAESLSELGRKERACEEYRKVISAGEGSPFAESAALRLASLSFGMERYSDAYDAYTVLMNMAKIDDNVFAAKLGRMRSAFRARSYDDAIAAARVVENEKKADEAQKREASLVEAKSCLATSRRDEAFAIFKTLAKTPATNEGAEAAYLVIQDTYDQGDFGSVEKKVYAFADAAPSQSYWLAKAFIVLGDSFMENDKVKQAKATFESVRDGYEPSPEGDDVMDQVKMRLEKLAELTNQR